MGLGVKKKKRTAKPSGDADARALSFAQSPLPSSAACRGGIMREGRERGGRKWEKGGDEREEGEKRACLEYAES